MGEDVRWNDPTAQRPFIAEIVKVKLSDLDLTSISQVSLADETIYFVGHRGKESTLYFMHVYYFFSTQNKPNSMPDSALASPVPHRDQPPPKSRVIVAHPRPSTVLQQPDFLYIRSSPYSLTLKTQQNHYDIANYSSPIELVTHPLSLFPVVVW